MTLCVLDCSVAIAWCFEDEATPATEALLDAVATNGAVVPGLWSLELASTLQMGLRRKRIDPCEVAGVLDALARLPLRTLESPAGQPARLADRLRQRCAGSGLTAYDQTYLDAALAEALPLATPDAALRRAAGIEGVAVLPA